jgi:hypothetical protein
LCKDGKCDFLIAVPVKWFASGDTNRDLHMLQVTHGAESPMVVVRTTLSESSLQSSEIHADLQIQFARQTATFAQVPFHLTKQGGEVQITGTIPASLSDFKIPPPELLFVPIKNQIPVDVQMSWQEQ